MEETPLLITMQRRPVQEGHHRASWERQNCEGNERQWLPELRDETDIPLQNTEFYGSGSILYGIIVVGICHYIFVKTVEFSGPRMSVSFHVKFLDKYVST